MSRTARDHAVIVVGAGIAGCEAAWVTARAGLRTLLVTTSLDTVYQLAHDSAALRPEPGTLLAELALDLASPNAPAGEPLSAAALRRAARRRLEALPALHLLQSTVSALVCADDSVVGVTTWEGVEHRAREVALCVGSFLRARLSVGAVVEQQGRLSEMAYDDLYLDLSERGFEFRPLELTARQVAGALPYRVASVALAASEAASVEASEQPSEAARLTVAGFRLRRFSGLWAAGVCAPRAALELPDYERCAAEGRALGQALVAASQG